MNNEFVKNGYTVIRGLFEPEQVQVLQTYFDLKNRVLQSDINSKNKHTSTIRGNKDVTDSLVFYADTLTETYALLYGPAICQHLSLNLSPTYTYTRIYEKGSILLPHKDRPACEVSLTCPISISDNRGSTIFISNYVVPNEWPSTKTIDEVRLKGDYTRVDLMPGDAMIYSGCDRYHWREPLESDQLIQFFMHYIVTDGKNADEVFDRRPYMGFDNQYRSPIVI
jgi:hypothetical protein